MTFSHWADCVCLCCGASSVIDGLWLPIILTVFISGGCGVMTCATFGLSLCNKHRRWWTLPLCPLCYLIPQRCSPPLQSSPIKWDINSCRWRIAPLPLSADCFIRSWCSSCRLMFVCLSCCHHCDDTWADFTPDFPLTPLSPLSLVLIVYLGGL